jgi:hypothetical protein
VKAGPDILSSARPWRLKAGQGFNPDLRYATVAGIGTATIA